MQARFGSISVIYTPVAPRRLYQPVHNNIAMSWILNTDAGWGENPWSFEWGSPDRFVDRTSARPPKAKRHWRGKPQPSTEEPQPPKDEAPPQKGKPVWAKKVFGPPTPESTTNAAAALWSARRDNKARACPKAWIDLPRVGDDILGRYYKKREFVPRGRSSYKGGHSGCITPGPHVHGCNNRGRKVVDTARFI